MVDRTGAYRNMVGRPEGRRPLGRPRHRWDNNIKVDVEEVGWGGMDWIAVAQERDRLYGTCKSMVYIKCWVLFGLLRTCQLLRKDSAPWV
jgi:hypothetical protein